MKISEDLHQAIDILTIQACFIIILVTTQGPTRFILCILFIPAEILFLKLTKKYIKTKPVKENNGTPEQSGTNYINTLAR